MSRFETLVLADRRDEWGIPRRTATAVVNVTEICTVHDVTIDTTYKAGLSPTCPAAVFPTLEIGLRNGTTHHLLLGQFTDWTDARRELNRFTVWLTGRSLS